MLFNMGILMSVLGRLDIDNPLMQEQEKHAHRDFSSFFFLLDKIYDQHGEPTLAYIVPRTQGME